MKSIAQILSDPAVVLIFAYSPVGLGHLRVTEALYQGLPEEVEPVLLGSQDKMIANTYHLISINPLGRRLMEWTQNGLIEDIYTYFYRYFLRLQTNLIYEQMVTILDERIELPKLVLVVATHFGLAHQLAAVKKKIEKDKYVKIQLIVQVTDDSPQHIWYVMGADLIFVPSEKTKLSLEKYGEERKLAKVKFIVNPYPISPAMGENFDYPEYEQRVKQLDPQSKSIIHFSMPVSGAAVGTSFLIELMDALNKKSNRFCFHVVSKESSYTKSFIKHVKSKHFVHLNTSPSSREIVQKYEDLYQKEIITLELTKPSEQAFKALFNPRQKGGAILLFSKPIGRQEYDNLNFLRNHNLIPSLKEKEELFQKFSENSILEFNSSILQKATYWRGIEMPEDPFKAADFIWWCFEQKIFLTMLGSFTSPKLDHLELGSDGIKQFWSKIANLIEEQTP